MAAGVLHMSARAANCSRPGCHTPLFRPGSPMAIVILVLCAAMFFFSMWSNNRRYAHWRQNEGATWDPESGPPPNPPRYRGTRANLPMNGPLVTLVTLFVIGGALFRGNFGMSSLPMLGALALAGASIYSYSRNRSRSR